MTNNTNSAPIALSCSECGSGNYFHLWVDDYTWSCDECGHAIATSDVELEAGEVMAVTPDGALAYIPAAE